MMAAPMGIVMLVVMRSMFEKSKLNYALHAAFAGLLVTSFLLARTQTPVGNGQFLRSMIPHHSSAILMCEGSSITDAELARLCEQIVRTQKEEIALWAVQRGTVSVRVLSGTSPGHRRVP